MDREQKDNKNASNKKKVLIFFGVLIAALILLLLLDRIDFDSISDRITEKDSDAPEKTESQVVTVDPFFLAEPNYNEDITADADYMKMNRNLHFSTGEESIEIINRSDSGDPVCQFFYDYFATVIPGNYKDYPSFFTEDYQKKNKFEPFTPQKLYDITVTHKSSAYLENGDASGKYKGYSVYYFEVAYYIKDNNGTFRDDFYGDDGTLPLIFELLVKNDVVKISSVKRYNYVTSAPKSDVKVSVSFFVWLVIFVVFVLLLIIFRRKALIPAIAASLICAALSLFGTGVLWQLLVFSALAIPAGLIIFKKNKKISNPPAKTEGDKT